jgi:hypothetical protein
VTEEQRKRHREYQRRWRAANPERARAIAQRSARKHAEKRRLRSAEWRRQNPEKVAAALARRVRPTWEELRPKRLPQVYGLTVDEYDLLLNSQGAVCAICGKPCSSGRRLAVDHDHVTGMTRGLLCHLCNRGAGLLRGFRRAASAGTPVPPARRDHAARRFLDPAPSTARRGGFFACCKGPQGSGRCPPLVKRGSVWPRCET